MSGTRDDPARRFRAWSRPERGRLAAAGLLAACAALSLPLPALYRQTLIDHAIPTADRDMLLRFSLGLLALLAGRALAQGGLEWLLAAAGRRFQTHLHEHLAGRLLRLPLGAAARFGVGDLMARFNESQSVRHLLLDARVLVRLDAAWLTLASLGLLAYDARLALLALLGLAVQAAAWRAEQPGLRAARQRVSTAASHLGTELDDLLHAAALLRAYAAEDYGQRRLGVAIRDLQAALYRTRALAARRGATALALTTGTTLAGTLLGARLVMLDTLSVGELAGFCGLLGLACAPLERLTATLAARQEGLLAAERVAEVLDATPTEERGELESPLSGALTLDDVTFHHTPGTTPTLERVSLHVAPGMLVALVGRSGSGKTTLLEIILRLREPDSGRLLFDGVDARRFRLAHLRARIACLPQGCDLLAGSVRDNLLLGRSGIADEALRAALEQAGLAHVVARLPRGLDTPVGARGTRLSGGERQRLALARALLGAPRILLLDEPTSALDGRSEAHLAATLRKLTGTCTILLSTHRVALMRACDWVLVLERGRIVAQGPPARLGRPQRTRAGVTGAQSRARVRPRARAEGR